MQILKVGQSTNVKPNFQFRQYYENEIKIETTIKLPANTYVNSIDFKQISAACACL